MSNKKKNKRVGQGMKPRPQQTRVINGSEYVLGVDTSSAAEGQGAGGYNGFVSVVQPVETGKELAEDSVQILDSAETADVAADTLSPEPGTYGAIERGNYGDLTTPGLREYLPKERRSSLEALMGRTDIPADPAKDGDAAYAAGLAKALDIPAEQPEGVIHAAMFGVMGARVGQREDGTFGLVVTIPEGMIEPIRQQAEADRTTPEEWVSTRLNEYLDSWWSAPKGR